MKVKSAMMVAPGDFTVTSNTGHVIRFKAGEETFVPGIMVRACKQYGAVEKKRFTDTVQDVPAPATKVTSSIHLSPHRPDMEAVEEITRAELAEQKEAPSEDGDGHFTPSENKVRSVINNLVAAADEDSFTAAGVPKTHAINEQLQDFTISADTRNAVWDKMIDTGEVPEDWYAEESDG